MKYTKLVVVFVVTDLVTQEKIQKLLFLFSDICRAPQEFSNKEPTTDQSLGTHIDLRKVLKLFKINHRNPIAKLAQMPKNNCFQKVFETHV